MSGAISKARAFYFNVYLPTVVPCVIISEHNGNFEPLNFAELVLSPNVKSSEYNANSPGNTKLSDSVKSVRAFR